MKKNVMIPVLLLLFLNIVISMDIKRVYKINLEDPLEEQYRKIVADRRDD